MAVSSPLLRGLFCNIYTCTCVCCNALLFAGWGRQWCAHLKQSERTLWLKNTARCTHGALSRQQRLRAAAHPSLSPLRRRPFLQTPAHHTQHLHAPRQRTCRSPMDVDGIAAPRHPSRAPPPEEGGGGGGAREKSSSTFVCLRRDFCPTRLHPIASRGAALPLQSDHGGRALFLAGANSSMMTMTNKATAANHPYQITSAGRTKRACV